MDAKRALRVTAVLVCFACAVSAFSAGPDPGIRAITRPSADVTLSFVQPGRITEILFTEGATVKAGQVLVQLDDALEQAQRAQILAQSEDTTQILASEASAEQKKLDLQKLEKAAERKAATELEVEHARLDAKIADLSVELARFEHRQAQLKLEEAKIHVENMRLKSPIEGKVEEVFIESGESVNALDKVIRVVRIDPLWIDASIPVVQVTALKPESTVGVEFPAPNPASTRGRIVFIAAVADAASGTIKARIEVPNPAGRPAGEQVRVVCPAGAVAGAGAR